MNSEVHIVHVVLKRTSVGCRVQGVFDIDTAAINLRESLVKEGHDAVVDSWVVSCGGEQAQQLIKKELYDKGDRVMFDDGITSGAASISSRSEDPVLDPSQTLYRMVYDGDVIHMLGYDIKGVIVKSDVAE